VDFKTSISLNQYPTTSYADLLSRFGVISDVFSIDEFSQQLKDNILKVNVYFDSLSYTSISEAPSIELISFISNVGGLLGLFLGATVLSFLEIVEFVIIIIQIIQKRNSSQVASIEGPKRVQVSPIGKNI
jgi:hypothetical protein